MINLRRSHLFIFQVTYDWLSYNAEHMKKVTGIKTYHQFVFSSSSPGTVLCKQYSDSVGIPVNIIKVTNWEPSPFVLPSTIVPKGLSADRQWYLYDIIRPYCEEYSADTTCPLPTVDRTRTPRSSPRGTPPTSPRPSSSSGPSTKSQGYALSVAKRDTLVISDPSFVAHDPSCT